MCGMTSRHAQICINCQLDLPILPQHCQQCARFIHGDLATKICGFCMQNPPPFERILALFPYEQPVVQLIKQLKFGAQLSHALAFSELMIRQITEHWYTSQALPDLLMPIPLHPLRLRERGFNQALEIGRLVAKHFLIPIDTESMLRVRHTRAQSDLSAPERKINIKNAFIAKRNFQDLKIAVIDDVITTSSTVREFCSVLRKNNARQIDVWCIARRG